ncbi:MAG: GNAT family acetyltransferase [Lachnospiraceae bacterium]|nr:GNAT family acetyltransferase [Lachnospiraceae bacterium]
MEEISLKGIFSLELIRKERFAGSCGMMRYMLMMDDGKMKASVYPEPYCWEATPEDQKESQFFEYSAEGIEAMVKWLNQKYHEKFCG